MSLGLLGLFAFAITISLGRGRRPTCRCFGKLNSKPIGWRIWRSTGVSNTSCLCSLAELGQSPALWSALKIC